MDLTSEMLLDLHNIVLFVEWDICAVLCSDLGIVTPADCQEALPT